MLLSDVMSQINMAFRGSDDDAPTSGTPDYTLWLGTINRKQSEWAKDTKQVWLSSFNLDSPAEPGTVATTGTTTLTGTSTYFTDYRVGDTITVSGETVRTIATITSDTVLTVTVAFSNTASAKTFTHKTIVASGVQSYNVPRYLINPSDQVEVVTTDNTAYFKIGKPQERARFENEVYISGRLPQVITFYQDIDSDSNLVGGTLRIPGYYTPADLVKATDTVLVDDPYWLVYATASELAFNDLTYESKYDQLNVKANNLYSQMAANNRRGTNNWPRIANTNVDRIKGPSAERIQ